MDQNADETIATEPTLVLPNGTDQNDYREKKEVKADSPATSKLRD